MRICVFCSSNRADSPYKEVAEEVGIQIGTLGHELVYGGSERGLMGLVSHSAKKMGARVLAVWPKVFIPLAGPQDELISCENLRDRKQIMEKNSDAFIILAGGLGTLDEIADVLVDRYIDTHQKPIIIINTDNFFEYLLLHIRKIYEERFSQNPIEPLLIVANTPKEAFDALKSYSPIKQKPLPYKA